jgi:hypothetical protein
MEAVFVGAAVEADLVAGVADGGTVFGEGFEGMAWRCQLLRRMSRQTR